MAKQPSSKSFRIVCEGDSWERLPNFGAKSLPIVGGTGYDLARGLTDLGHKVENLAYWGDKLSEIAETKDYLRALTELKYTHFLLGGGGNDLLANGNLQNLIRVFDKDRKPEDYLKPVFFDMLDGIYTNYNKILMSLQKAGLTEVRVFIHGYDYAEPMRLGWIGNPMELMGITSSHDLDLQRAIVRLMIDHFNDMLAKIATKWPNVTHVDFRGMVGKDWHDELHPRKEAFVKLAAHLAKSF